MPLAQEDEIVYLYDAAGVAMAVQNGVAIPAGTSGLLLMGTDGTNARRLGVNASGQAAIQNPPNLDVALSTRAASTQLPAALVGGRLDGNIGAWLGSTAPTVGQKAMAASVPIAIASDQSAIPVSVSGATEKATFVAAALATATANLKSMVSLANATGSAVTVQIRQIWLVNVQTTAVTGVACQFNLRRFTSHAAGTAITPQPFDTTDAVNVAVTARTGATITGESAASLWSLRWSTDEWGPGALDVESYQNGVQAASPYWAQRYADSTKPIVLRADEGVTLKCETNTTTGLFNVFVVFTQE
jgi:hypothetical protein